MPRITKNLLKVDDAIEDFMIFCTNQDLTVKTRKSYESTLKLFSKYLEEEHDIKALEYITEKHIREYLEFTKERGKYSYVANVKTLDINNPQNRSDFGKNISTSTLNNYLRNIKVFINFCYNNRLIKTNVAEKIKQFKNSRKPKEDITNQDFEKLMKVMDLTLFAEYRDYIIIQLLMDTGQRIGECLSLKTKDVLVDKRAIFISADIAKGRKDRYVFYSLTMQRYLKRWIDYKDRYFDSDLLFVSSRNNPLSVSNFEKNIKKYVTRAGLNKNITAHVFRNNFAKRALLNGMDIYMLSRILGHSSVTVTEQAYMDLTVEDIRKSYQLYSPLENMQKKK